MPERGPVPKRDDQRRRRDQSTRAEAANAPSIPFEHPPADEAWHPMAITWYESLAISGQAVWYEASDWAYAQVTAQQLSDMLRKSITAAGMDAFTRSVSKLLGTEGDRRRVRVELLKAGGTDDAADSALSALEDYRGRLTG